MDPSLLHKLNVSPWFVIGVPALGKIVIDHAKYAVAIQVTDTRDVYRGVFSYAFLEEEWVRSQSVALISGPDIASRLRKSFAQTHETLKDLPSAPRSLFDTQNPPNPAAIVSLENSVIPTFYNDGDRDGGLKQCDLQLILKLFMNEGSPIPVYMKSTLYAVSQEESLAVLWSSLCLPFAIKADNAVYTELAGKIPVFVHKDSRASESSHHGAALSRELSSSNNNTFEQLHQHHHYYDEPAVDSAYKTGEDEVDRMVRFERADKAARQRQTQTLRYIGDDDGAGDDGVVSLSQNPRRIGGPFLPHSASDNAISDESSFLQSSSRNEQPAPAAHQSVSHGDSPTSENEGGPPKKKRKVRL
eukprot:ANDGO_07985.mRNA.1 hypothetical protein